MSANSQNSELKELLEKVVESISLLSARTAGEGEPIQVLINQRSEKAEEQREPWRKEYKKYASLNSSFDADFAKYTADDIDPLEGLRADFRALMANQALTGSSLSPSEMSELSYLLFASPETQYARARSILTMTRTDRIRLHNWRVFNALSIECQSRVGPNLSGLEYPLFPAVEDFMAINTALVTSWVSAQAVGGASNGVGPQRFFAKEATYEGETGGYSLPVVNNTVDLTHVEESFKYLQTQQQFLQQQLATVNKKMATLNNSRNNRPKKSKKKGGGAEEDTEEENIGAAPTPLN